MHLIAHLGEGRTATSQLYFPVTLTDTVFNRPPHRHRRQRDTTNDTGTIFAGGGRDPVLHLVERGDGIVGTSRLVSGRREHFAQVLTERRSVELVLLTVTGHRAAFHFRATSYEGTSEVIDTMTFDEAGLITSRQAYSAQSS